MALQGWQFAAELSQLRIIGQIDLPTLGYTYASMNTAVDSTQGQEAAAFQQPGGRTAAAHAAWSGLRDDLQNIFGQNANAMHEAATVMLHIVDAYEQTDNAARDSINSAWANGQTPGLTAVEDQFTYKQPPPVVLKNQY